MNDLRGMPSVPSFAGAAGGASGTGMAPPSHFPNGTPSLPPSNTRRSIHMTKQPGEGSFGMTLEEDATASTADCPRVSYVFPNSAAGRAGVRSGWTIEFINGVSCRGRRVREVAPVFRDLQEVVLYVDIRTETAPVTTLPTLVGGSNYPSSSGFAPHASTPPPPVWAPRPNMAPPPVARSVVPTYSSVGFPTSTAYSNGTMSAAMAYMQATMHGHFTGAMGATPTTSGMTQSAVLPSHRPPQMGAPRWQQPPISTAATQPHASAMSVSYHGPSASQQRSESTGAASSSQVSSRSSAPPASTAAPPRAAPATVPTMVAATRSTVVPQASAAVSNRTAPSNTVVSVTRTTTSASPSAPAPSSARGAAPVSASTTTRAPAPAEASASAQGEVETTRASGKKRRRAQSTGAASATLADTTATTPSAPAAAGARRGRPPKQRRQSAPPTVSDMWDSEDAVFFYGSDDPDVQEVSPPPAGSSNRRTSSRQAESGGRARRSLTVSRLMTMGFTQEDAELSVQTCGHDPDKCMLWIVSYLEDKQFTNDLNKASIESENQKRLEAQQQKQEESETLRQATAFTSLFPTSYILSEHANAPRLRAMLSATIGDVAADTLMRTLVTKLLTLESKAIRWYKDAAKCYMLELAARLEIAFGSHDAVTCCATVMATQQAAEACAFVRALHEEEQALNRALFFMPENQGGVPLAFLRADESMQFSLDDDGFEVVDQPPSAASPDHD